MIKIAICEDEEIQFKILEKHVKAWGIEKEISTNIVYYKNAESFLFSFSENDDFDIIFLDVHMENMNGIELSKKIREIDENVAIIFVTGVSEYISKGYGVGAINYLIKPLNSEDLKETLDRAYKSIKYDKERKNVLKVFVEKENMKIKYNEIKYFVIYSHYINIETVKGEISYKKKISDLEKELPEEQFVRCHRSYIVNLHYVKSVGKDSLTLDDNITIPISRGKKDKIVEKFMRYFNN